MPLILLIVSVFFGIWAAAAMRFRFNILPSPLTGTRLMTKGPYAYVRHPMYTTLVFGTLALVINSFSTSKLIAWILLATVLYVKSLIEERILTKHFPEYENYSNITKRIIPFII